MIYLGWLQQENPMLRSLFAFAPLIAAAMVVVLLIDPPALTPAERIPTLHVLNRGNRSPATQDLHRAIALGEKGRPPLSVIPRVHTTTEAQPSREAAGVLYTPFHRVAWVAYRRQLVNRPLTPAEVPLWLSAPVVYVALRYPPGALTIPTLALVPAGSSTCCTHPQPTLLRPIWVTAEIEPIRRFGAPVPFPDLGLVAAYPQDLLENVIDGFVDIDVVAFYRHEGIDGPTSTEMRGRIRRTDLETLY